MSLDAEELEAFLGQTSPTPLGVVGTLRPDGSPNVMPVWFRWDGTSVKIWTTNTRAWVRHLKRDPRVAFSVQTFNAPYPAVVLRGVAIMTSGDEPSHPRRDSAITRRYVQADEVEHYVANWPALRTIVTISPEKIISWAEGG